MRSKTNITLTLTNLSPEAAYALSNLLEDLTHQVDLYYANEIRCLLRMRDREIEVMNEIAQGMPRQQELDLDDPIPF